MGVTICASPGGSLTCDCQEGYEGSNCGECSSGYYGAPTVVGGSCEQCSSCSNNTDITADYCDTTTGDCLLCLFVSCTLHHFNKIQDTRLLHFISS